MVDRGSVALGSIPDDAPATTRDVLEEPWDPEPRVQVEPRNAATRSEARWRGLAAVLRGFIRVLFGLSLPPRLCWLGVSGWGRRWLARWLFGVRVQDPECAFRLFRRSIFRRIPIQTARAQRLKSLPGVGTVLGATIYLEVGEVTRFASPEQLASYSGLVRSCTPAADEPFWAAPASARTPTSGGLSWKRRT